LLFCLYLEVLFPQNFHVFSGLLFEDELGRGVGREGTWVREGQVAGEVDASDEGVEVGEDHFKLESGLFD
jgi:hypothetical protein